MRIRVCSRISIGTLVLSVLYLTQMMAQAPAPAPHQEPDPGRISAVAHKLLAAAIKINGLNGDELKPWHMKVEFQMLSGGATKPTVGTMEEWYANRYHWRRTYAGSETSWKGTEWRVSRIESYASNPRHGQFNLGWMNLRVGRPVVDPLYQVGNISRDAALKVERLTTSDLALNCTSLADPSEKEWGKKPEWIVPMMCFDHELHLRLVHSEETVVQFGDIEPFQGRAVARDVKIIFNGQLSAEMKITRLEMVNAIDGAVMQPEATAEMQPYEIEPSDPQPETVFEAGTTIPLLPGAEPFRGMVMVPIVIRKDGTVEIAGGVGPGSEQGLFDAITTAVSRWKYKPYLVENQPVEAAYTVRYRVDGKPFVPSYERAKTAQANGGQAN